MAIAICNRCPERDDCLTHALKNKIKYGVWGGLTEEQRRKILHPPQKQYPRPKSTLPIPPPSGVRGVSWNTSKGCWVVLIRHGGATHWVGTFKDQGEAEAAAIAKCGELGTSIQRRSGGISLGPLDI